MDIAPLMRSHLERSLQDQLELCRTELELDDDGDYPITHGDVVYYVRLIEAGRSFWVRIWAPVVVQVKRTPALLRELNDLNARCPMVRYSHRHGVVYVEADMHASAVSSEHLGQACRYVGDAVVEMGETLAAVFGGHRVPAHSCDEEVS